MADRLVVLREGRVQQVGTPQQLHDAPVNWHVADFMGYRNILDVTVTEVGGPASEGTARTARVDAGGIPLTVTAMEDLRVGEVGRLAIRPEDLTVIGEGEQPRAGNVLDAEVSVVEYHGREFSVGVVNPDGATWHVRSLFAPEPGAPVRLTVDPTRALLFRNSDSSLTPTERDLEEART